MLHSRYATVLDEFTTRRPNCTLDNNPGALETGDNDGHVDKGSDAPLLQKSLRIIYVASKYFSRRLSKFDVIVHP